MSPVFYLYVRVKGLEGNRHYRTAAYSLGNLGFSKSVCISDYVELPSNRVIGCEVGTINELYSFGIIPKQGALNSDSLFGYCGKSTMNPSVDSCSDSLNYE